MSVSLDRFFEKYISSWYIPELKAVDIIEIIIISVLIYELIVWIKNTKASMLLKGMLVLGVFILIAAILEMNTILFLAKHAIDVLATAAIVVFQPELRRALEKLGEKNILASVVPIDKKKETARFSEDTVEGIVRASFAMGKVKTGALIVVERAIQLTEYESTGIRLDCIVSSQVLINIFEHNTPLHDGAIIVRGDRITSATCYLPLSDNMRISKELGTRHRAALGMSEVSDALVIAVSEETGAVSVAMGGRLERNVTPDRLRECLMDVQDRTVERKRLVPERLRQWKGRKSNERKTDN